MGQAAQRAPADNAVHYERRRPEESVLYRLVQEQFETFLVQVEAETDASLPAFINCQIVRALLAQDKFACSGLLKTSRSIMSASAFR